MKNFILSLLIGLVVFGLTACKERAEYAATTDEHECNDSLIKLTLTESLALINHIKQMDTKDSGDTLTSTITRTLIIEGDSIVATATFHIPRHAQQRVVEANSNAPLTLGNATFYKERFRKGAGHHYADQELSMDLYYELPYGFYGILTGTIAMRPGNKPPFRRLEAMETCLEN